MKIHKGISKVIWLSLLGIYIFLSCLLPKVKAQEVSFKITDQLIQASVHKDGSVSFVDYQYYDADYMNGAVFTLDHTGYQVTDLRVGVSDSIEGPISYLEESHSRQAKTYQVSDQNGLLTMKVFYPLSNAGKYFIYHYTLPQLITNYQDTAELLRRFGTSDDTTNVKVRIQLPGLVKEKNLLRAWGYGAPQGQVTLVQESGNSVVYLDVPNRTADQFVEGHIVFPTTLTADNPNRKAEKRLDQIINTAQDRVDQDARQQVKQANWGLGLAIIGGVCPLILALLAFWIYFKKVKHLNPNPVYVPDYLYDLPEKLSPAQMATYYFRLKPNEDDFVATLLHLVQKGWIKMQVEDSQVARSKAPIIRLAYPNPGIVNQTELLEHEKLVWEYFNPGPNRDSISLDELEGATKTSDEFRESQYHLWERFTNKLSVEAERFRGRALEAQRLIKGLMAFSLIGIVATAILTVVFLASRATLEGFPLKWMAIIFGAGALISLLILLILLIMLKRRPIQTNQQQEMHDKWSAFAKMLKNIGNFKIREIASLPLWEEFLVYATSLGVADKVMKAIELEFKPSEINELNSPLVGMHNPYYFSRMLRRQINQTIQASQPPSNTGNFSGTNQGGFGGGFSSGSMGGSGGGTHSGGF